MQVPLNKIEMDKVLDQKEKELMFSKLIPYTIRESKIYSPNNKLTNLRGNYNWKKEIGEVIINGSREYFINGRKYRAIKVNTLHDYVCSSFFWPFLEEIYFAINKTILEESDEVFYVTVKYVKGYDDCEYHRGKATILVPCDVEYLDKLV